MFSNSPMLSIGADVLCVQLFPHTKGRGHKEVVRIYAQSMNGPNCDTQIKEGTCYGNKRYEVAIHQLRFDRPFLLVLNFLVLAPYISFVCLLTRNIIKRIYIRACLPSYSVTQKTLNDQ